MKKLGLLLMIGSAVLGAQLPGNLTPSDVDRITEVLGYGGAARLMRSAEPYESFPGFKLGVETALAPGSSMNNLGDNTGSIPGLIPAPRIYMAKGLFKDAEIILSLFTPVILDTLSSVGLITKWSFYNEESNYVSAAMYFGYTRLTAFKESYTGHDIELGAYFSRDYVRLKPYLGAGVLFANGTVAKELAPTIQSTWKTTVHFFLGMEFEFPINFTMQVDLMNTVPQGSILIAKKF